MTTRIAAAAIVAIVAIATLAYGCASEPPVDCRFLRNLEHHEDCEEERLRREYRHEQNRLRAERAAREAELKAHAEKRYAERCEQHPSWCEQPQAPQRSAPSRGPVYVDCNAFGVVNEDTDRAYRAADRGERCR